MPPVSKILVRGGGLVPIFYRLRIGLSVAAMLFTTGMHAHAATLTYASDTSLTFGSNTFTIKSGSASESFILQTDSIYVTVGSGDTFTLASSGKLAFSVSTTDRVNVECAATESKVTVTGPRSVTITPQTSQCGANGGSAGSSGSSSVTPAPAATVPTPAKTTTAQKTETPKVTTVTPKVETPATPTAPSKGAPAKTNASEGPMGEAMRPSSSKGTIALVKELSKEQVAVIRDSAGTLLELAVESAGELSAKEKKALPPPPVAARFASLAKKTSNPVVTVLLARDFVENGTEETERLGKGTRRGCLNSYVSAFGRMPDSESELADLVRICSGILPAERNKGSERYHQLRTYQLLYGKSAKVVSGSKEEKFVLIATYGLRPSTEERDLKKEAAATRAYTKKARKSKLNSDDWDIVRAIAYSGFVIPK